MFGPDTTLVFDALQLAGIVAAATGGAVFLMIRRRKRVRTEGPALEQGRTDLEQRVRVLERIATDRSIELADQIEALRDGKDLERSA